MAKKKKPEGRRQKAEGISLAAHPRAQRQIRQVKSYAGLAAFAYSAYVTWHTGATFVEAATRSVAWGLAAYVFVWALAVHVWRHLAIAEVRAAERRWREQKEAQQEQVRKLAQALEDNGMPTTGTGV